MKRYEKYKPSGVEWLGDVPEEWTVTKIKYISELNPKKSNLEKLDQECSFIPMEKLKLGNLLLDETRQVSDVYNSYTYFQNGDLLIAKVTPCFENKNFAIADNLVNGIGFGSSEIYVLRAKNCFNRYLFYRLQENTFMDLATGSMIGAGGLKRIPSDFLNDYVIALPPNKEQTAIANFLDKKTEKIDRLISRQQALLEKLSEKRTALITETVCGRVRLPTALNDNETLSSNVPLRNSGIEWLGEVPEHWEIKPLKFAVSYNDETLPENTDLDEEILYVDISSVSLTDGIKNKELMIFENAPSRARRIVKDGDVLVSTVRTYLKAIAQVESAEPNLIASTGFAVLRSKCGLNSQYLGYYIQSEGIVGAIVANSVGVSYPAINASDLVRLPICIPSETEQTIIANYLDKKTEKINHLQNKIERVIERLKEYRSALITQVVTGKVKV